MMADLQYRQRTRPSSPSFVAFAVSTTGELSPDACTLVSWIISKFKSSCVRAGSRPDGQTPKDMVTDFQSLYFEDDDDDDALKHEEEKNLGNFTPISSLNS